MKVFLKIFRYVFISLIALILVSFSIDAADNFGDIKQSVLGKMFFGEDAGVCPSFMVLVSSEDGDFCIDQYEASAGEDCSFSNPQNQKETRMNLDRQDCKPVSQAEKYPWRNISRDQASRACAKTGKRLATNSEWLQAALGTPDLSDNWTSNDCQVDNNWDNQPGLTGSGKNCRSSFGAYDMVGNVWEWVSATIDDGMFKNKKLPKAGYIDSTNGKGIPIKTNLQEANDNYNKDYFWLKSNGSRGMVRGGYWNNKSDAGVYSLYAVAPPSSAEIGIGFRCVK